jgi:hypothetical protein
MAGYRQYVAYTYIGFNIIGFLVNGWVFYVIAPLLFAKTVKVPKSILFYILILCVSDLMTMIGMLFLITEVVLGTWKFSAIACTSYLLFDSMNKFMAPIIVVLISRTCYATVCLEKKYQERAASLRLAIPLVVGSILLVVALLWPVFAYSEVFTLYLNANHTNKEVTVMKKCSFLPPPGVDVAFSVVACISSYALPLCGYMYWYMSVSRHVRKRAENTLIRRNGSSHAPIKKVTTTVLVLTAVYLLCWTPYWLCLFAHQILSLSQSRTLIITWYMVHLLPYVSCSAYPVIFTTMNRAIQSAHAEIMRHHRRRISTLTENATRHIRDVLGFKFSSRPDSRSYCKNREQTDISHCDISLESPSRVSMQPTATTPLNFSPSPTFLGTAEQKCPKNCDPAPSDDDEILL